MCLYLENYKSLNKEIESTSENIKISMFLGQKNQRVENILPKLLYRFNEIPIKNSKAVLQELKRVTDEALYEIIKHLIQLIQF